MLSWLPKKAPDAPQTIQGDGKLPVKEGEDSSEEEADDGALLVEPSSKTQSTSPAPVTWANAKAKNMTMGGCRNVVNNFTRGDRRQSNVFEVVQN